MKNKILKTAFNLMGEKTIKDVSMREIAQACNITKPTLYYYFKDKDEICYTIIKYVLDEQNNTIKKYIENNLCLENILVDIFQKTYQAKGKKSLGFFLHIIDYIKSVPTLEKRFKPLKEENDKMIKVIFDREVEKKCLDKKNKELACHLFQAWLHHIVFMSDNLSVIKPNDIVISIFKAIDYKRENI